MANHEASSALGFAAGHCSHNNHSLLSHKQFVQKADKQYLAAYQSKYYKKKKKPLRTVREGEPESARSDVSNYTEYTLRTSARTDRSSTFRSTGRSTFRTDRTDLTAAVKTLEEQKLDLEEQLRAVDAQLMNGLSSARKELRRAERPFAQFPNTFRAPKNILTSRPGVDPPPMLPSDITDSVKISARASARSRKGGATSRTSARSRKGGATSRTSARSRSSRTR